VDNAAAAAAAAAAEEDENVHGQNQLSELNAR